ncbi:Histone-lysine N-methyltransferase [Nymphaea thermarum]|nr:Histone-lysine N-methyltransferase [Nymphaea thermarum]
MQEEIAPTMGALKRCSSEEDFYGDFSPSTKKRKANFPRLDLLGDVAAAGLVLKNGVVYSPAYGGSRRSEDPEDISSLCTEVSCCSGEPESVKNPRGIGNGDLPGEVGQVPATRRSSGRVPVLPSRLRDSILDPWKKTTAKDVKFDAAIDKEEKMKGYSSQESVESAEDCIPEVPKYTWVRNSSSVTSFTSEKEGTASNRKKCSVQSKVEKLRRFIEPLAQNRMQFFNRLAEERSIVMDEAGNFPVGKVKNGHSVYRLEDFALGDVVWAKSAKKYPAWPAIVIDPMLQAPQSVLNSCIPGALCVMFFGFQGQTQLFKSKPSDFRLAIEEASLAEYGFFDPQSDGVSEDGQGLYLSANSRGAQEATDSNQDQESNSQDEASFSCYSIFVYMVWLMTGIGNTVRMTLNHKVRPVRVILLPVEWTDLCMPFLFVLDTDYGPPLMRGNVLDLKDADYFCPECKEKSNPVTKISAKWQQQLSDEAMEPAVGILKIPMKSFLQVCVICKQMHGSCTHCCKCYTPYHAMCASRAGYRMELHCIVKNGRQITKMVSYCASHRDPNPDTALVIKTPQGVFTMKGTQGKEKHPLSKTVSLDMEVPRGAGSQAPLPVSSSAAKCQTFEKPANRGAGCPIAHRLMGAHHHSIEIIQGLNSFAVLEYRGEQVRRSVADLREARYQAEGKGCYMWGNMLDPACKMYLFNPRESTTINLRLTVMSVKSPVSVDRPTAGDS